MDPYSKEFSEIINKINQYFYEQIYKDEWFKNVFQNVTQEFITLQQNDFMIQAFGGPCNFCGRMPGDAHPHIYIDNEMWEIRENYLKLSFEKNNVPKDIREKWLKIDNAFKNKIIKKSIDDVLPRFTTDEVIIILKEKKEAA